MQIEPHEARQLGREAVPVERVRVEIRMRRGPRKDGAQQDGAQSSRKRVIIALDRLDEMLLLEGKILRCPAAVVRNDQDMDDLAALRLVPSRFGDGEVIGPMEAGLGVGLDPSPLRGPERRRPGSASAARGASSESHYPSHQAGRPAPNPSSPASGPPTTSSRPPS